MITIDKFVSNETCHVNNQWYTIDKFVSLNLVTLVKLVVFWYKGEAITRMQYDWFDDSFVYVSCHV